MKQIGLWLMLPLAVLSLVGCGRDEPEQPRSAEHPSQQSSQSQQGYGSAAAGAIHGMLDEAKDSVDAINQQQQEIERRSRPDE
jgi:predicted small lipoprotein YifL